MRRWTSSYWFSWTPVITFTRRRMELLAWVEENLDPVAFTDGPDHVGLALLDPNVRLTIRRNGMQLEDRVALGTHSLLPAVEGLWEIMSPKSAVLEAATFTFTKDLPSLDYNEARGRFAESMSLLPSGTAGLRAVDASALMDVESVDSHGQVEWGIVSPPEFAERVSDPSLSRTTSQRSGVSISRVDVSEMPSASVFVETHLHRVHVPPVEDVHGIETSIDTVTEVCATVASSVAEKVLERLGEES